MVMSVARFQSFRRLILTDFGCLFMVYEVSLWLVLACHCHLINLGLGYIAFVQNIVHSSRVEYSSIQIRRRKLGDFASKCTASTSSFSPHGSFSIRIACNDMLKDERQSIYLG